MYLAGTGMDIAVSFRIYFAVSEGAYPLRFLRVCLGSPSFPSAVKKYLDRLLFGFLPPFLSVDACANWRGGRDHVLGWIWIRREMRPRAEGGNYPKQLVRAWDAAR
jgi:hypothetical protein